MTPSLYNAQDTMYAFTRHGETISVIADERVERCRAVDADSSLEVRGGPARSFQLVINDNAGEGKASYYANTLLRPLLELAGQNEVKEGGEVVVLLGGDGTLHDYLNGEHGKVDLVLFPCGTASALYASYFPSASTKLLSFLSAMRGNSGPRPLSLARVNGRTLASVIVSAALHASILHDSERLRAHDPSVERFKSAAMQNITRRYPGTLRLSSHVRRYSPATKRFESSEDREVEGPFSYLLLAALTDRLEPTFVVAPLRRGDKSPGLDVVVIRPGASTVERDAQAFAQEVLMPVTGAMYDGGKHIDLVYAADGSIRAWQEDDKAVTVVVDYYRADKVEWTPHSSSPPDERDRLLCIDGALETIKEGETTTIELVPIEESPRVYV